MDTMQSRSETENRHNPYRADASDRVLVVLDVRNITCFQSSNYTNTEIDYAKLLSDVIRGRKCVAAIAADGLKTDFRGRDENRIFHRELIAAGFRLDLVEPSNNKGKQEGVDVEIALTAQEYAMRNLVDVVELITGDGDFGVLVKRIQSYGVLVDVVSFFKNLSHSLSDRADSVSLLDDLAAIRMRPKIREAV